MEFYDACVQLTYMRCMISYLRDVVANGDLLFVVMHHQITEENQRVFWTEMAPNVDDYGNSLAKAIASGTGQIIRGIFWVRDSTVVKLENGSLNVTQKSNPTDKPTNIRPSTLRNLERYISSLLVR